MKANIKFVTFVSVKSLSEIFSILDHGSPSHMIKQMNFTLSAEIDETKISHVDNWFDTFNEYIKFTMQKCMETITEAEVVFVHPTQLEIEDNEKTITFLNKTIPGLVHPDLFKLRSLDANLGVAYAKPVIQELVGKFFIVEADDNGMNIQIKVKEEVTA